MCRRSEQWTGSGHSPRELPHAHVCPLPLHQSAELRLGPGIPSGNEGHEVSQSPKASVSSPVLLWSTLIEAAKNGPRKTLSGIFLWLLTWQVFAKISEFSQWRPWHCSSPGGFRFSEFLSNSFCGFLFFCLLVSNSLSQKYVCVSLFFVCWSQILWVKSMCVFLCSLFVGVKFFESKVCVFLCSFFVGVKFSESKVFCFFCSLFVGVGFSWVKSMCASLFFCLFRMHFAFWQGVSLQTGHYRSQSLFLDVSYVCLILTGCQCLRTQMTWAWRKAWTTLGQPCCLGSHAGSSSATWKFSSVNLQLHFWLLRKVCSIVLTHSGEITLCNRFIFCCLHYA